MDVRPKEKVENELDKYTASIEFSNACREFYISRVQAAENLKQQIKSAEQTTRLKPSVSKSSIQLSMDRLRKEMASLMDQDLSLMKQLLTLNEAIEDIKNQRLYGVSKDSLRESTGNLGDSDWSISDKDLYESDNEFKKKKIPKTSTTTHLTVPTDFPSPKIGRINSFRRKEHSHNRLCDTNICISIPKLVKTTCETVTDTSSLSVKKVQVIHGAQGSIDSGYDESDSYQTDIEITVFHTDIIAVSSAIHGTSKGARPELVNSRLKKTARNYLTSGKL